MKKTFNVKQVAVYIGVIIAFSVVALFYFKPVLKGYKIFQSDIAQFRGMSKELKDYRAENGKEAFWTDAAFGGMPSYQLSTYYPNDYIKKLDSLIRFLPRPADYLFLYFLGFFVLLTVLKFDWKLALIGSLAFGFSTYFIIILGVGHNAKAHAIGYIPLVLAGVLLLFQKRYVVGFVLTALATSLEMQASHPQMTYYMLFMLLFVGLFFVIEQIKKGILKSSLKPISLVVLAMVIGLLTNAQSMLATKEYAAHSTRSKSELTVTSDGKPKEVSTGLSKDYITEYSYGILETFNLMIPRLVGGANNEDLGRDSNTYKFLASKIGAGQAVNFSKSVPTYWGNQPIVAAPAYIGVVFVFLFFIGCFLVKGWIKKGLVAATIFSILLSWGKNFGFLTDLFIDYMPLYNKFRAVSSIQVIAEICIPLLGMLALKEFFSDTVPKEEKIESTKIATILIGGILIIFTFFGGMLFSFSGLNDAYYNQQIPGFSGALQADRKDILFSDGLRSIVLVAITVGVLWMVLNVKIKKQYGILVLGVVMLFDTLTVAKRYVNDDDFLPANKVEKPFSPSAADKQILQDKSHYRVANFSGNFMNDGATSYYHNSIGGYHAAKPRRYQELVDYQLSKNNMEIINMLNTKYFIVASEQGQPEAQKNPDANGNAWFVHNIISVDNADDEILALTDFDSKNDVVINTQDFKVQPTEVDSTATISLVSYEPNELVYTSQSEKTQLAVFSEMYYQPGWNAYVDGKLTPHYRANYVLRAMNIPAGKHKIIFKFEPKVIQQGSMLSLVGYGLLILVSVGIFFIEKKKQ
ncbi:YfhO family protein [Wenyingzhuangia marina]|uniref:Membrane protein YfhO n=1 Tax=Wenyingzhuangia marina TaxID=1195760 RepID=A0A1M5W1B9_9FLAO|nr:YfhO family protein [Wenyingzhuangia marina]GGF76591.1 membrane protein [Wenyingzhuangia marina]SHH81230.1 membrane protein YfhO [Wenyingzhuangia marina]